VGGSGKDGGVGSTEADDGWLKTGRQAVGIGSCEGGKGGWEEAVGLGDM
jgi:hypothetical protein